MMKFTRLLLILFVLAFVSTSCKDTKGIINSNSGLVLRTHPNITAERIDLIPNGIEVSILDKNGPAETIYGISGNWYKVKYNGKTGWAFGGLISEKNMQNDSNDQGTRYKIGSQGPAGGWIFYDKGSYSDGWRYLEVSPEDLDEVPWGCHNISIQNAQYTAIGTGKSNTRSINEGCTDTNIAAKIAVKYRGGGKSDWFLPSKDELNEIYTNLYKTRVINFKYNAYWSSSELYADRAWYHFFSYADQPLSFKNADIGVRAVRAF